MFTLKALAFKAKKVRQFPSSYNQENTYGKYFRNCRLLSKQISLYYRMILFDYCKFVLFQQTNLRQNLARNDDSRLYKHLFTIYISYIT